MSPIIARPPTAAPIPIPAFAPVLKLPELEELLLTVRAVAEADAAAGAEGFEVEPLELVEAATVLTALGTV